MSVERKQYKTADVADEQGFVLIVTMLMLVVLTVLCIGALDNSTIEVQIAANDRQSRVAFNLADGGTLSAAKMIGQTVIDDVVPDYAAQGLLFTNFPDPDDPDYSPLKPLNSADLDKIINGPNDFFERVTNIKDPRTDEKYDFMLRTPNGLGDLYGRIASRESKAMEGESVEFAMSTEGDGAKGKVAYLYDLEIISFGGRNSTAQISILYRKVDNPGGL